MGAMTQPLTLASVDYEDQARFSLDIAQTSGLTPEEQRIHLTMAQTYASLALMAELRASRLAKLGD